MITLVGLYVKWATPTWGRSNTLSLPLTPTFYVLSI
jgi:hypothetical protein